MSKKPQAPAPKKKSSNVVLPVVAAVVVAGAAGGGWYYLRGSDPQAQADALLKKGDARGALIEQRNAVRKNPDSPVAHMKLGQLQLMLGDAVAGEKELKTARDMGGDRWAILPQLGQAYLNEGRYKDVLTEIPPEGPTPDIAAKDMMLRAMAQVALNDIDGAKATLGQAEKIAPNNVEVLLTGSRLALALKDMPLAEQKADQAVAADPKSVEALLMKGQVLLAKGDRTGAMAVSDQVVALAPESASARLDRANQLILQGSDAKAQADVDAVIKLQPRNAGAAYLNGVLMVRAGKYLEAGQEFTKLGAAGSRFPRTLYFQALVAANTGQLEQAIDYANRYVARMPGDADGVRLLARTLLSARQPGAAVAALNKAVQAGQNDSQTLDLLGRAYAMDGKARDSVATLQKASDLAPDDASILTHLASSQMQEGDSGNAESTLRKSIEMAPSQPNAAEALVAAALSAGDLARAESSLAELKKAQGDTETVGVLTGMLALAKLDLDGGRAAFAATLKQFPNSVQAKLDLAKVLVLQGRKAEGGALIKEILAKEPANVPALTAYVQLMIVDGQFGPAIQAVEAAKAAQPANKGFVAMLADVIVRSGDPRRAVAMLQATRDSEELTPLLQNALAQAQAAAGLNDEARRTFRDILSATPNDIAARRNQVDLLLRMKDFDGAAASLKDALAASPGNVGVMTSMVVLETQQHGVEAGLAMAQSLRSNTQNLPSSTILKGDVLMRAGQYQAAADAFLAEYKLNPSQPLALRLANAYASANDDKKSADALQGWLKDHPDDADAAQLLALVDIRTKQLGEAEKNLNIVLARRPGDTVALNNMAWLLQKKNDPKARQMAQRAYLQAPTPETADTLGWIMVKQGDVKGGLNLLKQSSLQRPADPTVKYHLAVALNDSGEAAEATKVLQQAVGDGQDFDDKGDARKLLDQLMAKK